MLLKDLKDILWCPKNMGGTNTHNPLSIFTIKLLKALANNRLFLINWIICIKIYVMYYLGVIILKYKSHSWNLLSVTIIHLHSIHHFSQPVCQIQPNNTYDDGAPLDYRTVLSLLWWPIIFTSTPSDPSLWGNRPRPTPERARECIHKMRTASAL